MSHHVAYYQITQQPIGLTAEPADAARMAQLPDTDFIEIVFFADPVLARRQMTPLFSMPLWRARKYGQTTFRGVGYDHAT